MKLAGSTLTILFALLAVASCAPLETAAPPAQPLDVLTDQPTLSPVAGTVVPGGPAVCNCPTSIFATPSTGIPQPPLIICSCPAILVPPTQIESNPETVPTSGITLADNGKIFSMEPGERLLLILGNDGFNWSVTVDDQNVVSRVPNHLVIRGAWGIYEAHNPGQATMTAVGDPLCRSSLPMCMAPSIIFRITVVVL